MSMWNLQVALDNRLYGNVIYNGAVVPVYDTIPDDNTLPYIRFGEDTNTNWGTKLDYGHDITHTLHVFSKQNFKREVKQIMYIVETLLREPLDGVFLCFVEFQEVFEEEKENVTIQHGVMRIRAKIKE